MEKLTSKYETRLEHLDKKKWGWISCWIQDSAREKKPLIFHSNLRSKRHKEKGAIERMVEDMISESMANGEFENLPGKGKPLPDRTRLGVYYYIIIGKKSKFESKCLLPFSYNPFTDFTSHKINEILVEGGFAPEWVMLKKGKRKCM